MPNHGFVSFAEIRRHFDFRGIEMGRWVTSRERDRAAIQFAQALQDLMEILQVPESVISLRGTLGLQYGKGGKPSVAAHYTPSTRQLSLAKNAGAGSLAHEWFHAFDHYMAQKMFQQSLSADFASECWIRHLPLTLTRQNEPHPLNTMLQRCFHLIMLAEDGNTPSEMFDASRRIDSKLNLLYYSKPEEMVARAFEAFVEDANPNSQFLVRGSRYSEEAELGLYPFGEQRKKVCDAFCEYFYSLGATLTQGR